MSMPNTQVTGHQLAPAAVMVVPLMKGPLAWPLTSGLQALRQVPEEWGRGAPLPCSVRATTHPEASDTNP